MSEPSKVHLKMAGALVAGLALVLGVGGVYSLVTRGVSPTPARLASAVPARAVVLTPPAPSAPAPVPAAGASASPAPLLPADANPAAQAVASAPAPAPAAAAAPGAAASPRLKTTAHLDVEHQASVAAPTAPAVAKAAPKEEAPKPFAAPKLDLSRAQGAVASSVHYGVTSRAELMGRAAGPVYNFSGKLNSAQSAKNTQVAAGAMGQVDAAQAQVDALPLNEHDKAILGQQLDQAKEVVDKSSH